MFEKNTPRDFFLHVGAFISLYLGAVALLTLLFGLITFKFQDEIFGTYGAYDPYSGPMRFAIASLIILVPLAVYLFHVIQRETRKHPERRSLGVRKWLTYITLFIAGATVIVDLIVLLTSFLGGKLPTPFFLEVLAIFVVMGVGFWYFLLDIKGYWVAHATESRYVAMGVGLAVLISIVGGMMLIGSPMTQREIRLDTQQIQELLYIQSGVVAYWQQTGELPNSFADLRKNFLNTPFSEGIDGRPPYTYEKRSELSFALCATFEEPSPSNSYARMEMLNQNENWNHEEGEVCFERTIDPELMKPTPQPMYDY